MVIVKSHIRLINNRRISVKRHERTIPVRTRRLPIADFEKRFNKSKSPDAKLSRILTENYTSLVVIKYKKVQDNGYKYLIREGGAMGHVAFATDRGYRRFLMRTALKERLRERLQNGARVYDLIGTYKKEWYRGTQPLLDAYGRKLGMMPVKILDNGQYTKGWYKPGHIILLNPNYRRKIYPYFWE